MSSAYASFSFQNEFMTRVVYRASPNRKRDNDPPFYEKRVTEFLTCKWPSASVSKYGECSCVDLLHLIIQKE